MTPRLGIFATHPIQYFAPLWRALAATPGIELRVFFVSDHSVRGGVDPGFGVPVAWDVPLLEGYPSHFLARDADLSRPWRVKLEGVEALLEGQGLTAVLVHGYTHRFEWQVVRAARRRGLGVLMRGELSDLPRGPSRGWVRGLARQLYVRRFLSNVDAFCTVGERARRYLASIGVSEDRLFFSPYSVDAALLEGQRARWSKEEARAALGIPREAVVHLFSGKLTPRKDPLALLEALSRLSDRSRVWVVLLGDGELRDAVQSRGRELLGERLVMPGFVNQSQLGRYFAAADVFVLPSSFETWGLVVNEAQHFGLPVVCTRTVGSAADLVKEGETGFTYPEGDVQALAEVLARLGADPALRRRMGEAGHARIAAYTPEASARGVVAALHHVTKG